jgi:5-methylcytosine-specific restriction endonuclease McrA
MYVKGCDIDHWLALIDGGRHVQENFRPLCSSCHARKSAREHRNNSKCKRVAKKHSGQAREDKAKRKWPQPRPLRGRPAWPESRPLPSHKFPKRPESQK